jgi:hypothetical protein
VATVLSPNDKELITAPTSVCTSVCTSDGETAHDLAAKAASVDPDLAALIAAWDFLPAALRAGIVALVKAAGGA